jgi:hypothetical protein
MRTLILTILLLTALSLTARAYWFDDVWNGAALVTNQPLTDDNPLMIRGSTGRYFVTWSHFGDPISRGKYQVLTAIGTPLLGPEGQYVIEEEREVSSGRWVPDETGGAILFFEDERSGHWDVYGQRFDSLGNRLWGDTGLPLVIWPGSEDISLRDVASDSLGNIFLAWCYGVNQNLYMYMQKINFQGERLWGDFGVVECNISKSDYQKIVPDGQGGILDLWMDNRPQGGTSDPSNLYVQHLDANGNPLLQTNGLPLYYPGTTIQMPAWDIVKGVPDGDGGAVYYFVAGNYWRLMRLNWRGNIVWYTYEWVYQVWGTDLLWHPADGSLYFSYTTQSNRLLRRYSLQGIPLWETALPYGGLLTATRNGVITFSTVGHGQPSYIKATRVDSSGTLEWVSSVCQNSPWGFGGMSTTNDGMNGGVIAFEKNEPAVDPESNIYAQRVQANGTLGNPSPGPKEPDHPEIIISMVRNEGIRLSLPQAGNVRLELFDILGRRVRTLLDGHQEAGECLVPFDDKGLSAGVYVVRLTAGEVKAAVKVVVFH